MLRRIGMVVCLLVLGALPGLAGEQELVQGIRQVSLQIEPQDFDGVRVNLTRDGIAAVVKEGLEQGGITVVDGGEKPVLVVSVNVVKASFGYAASYRLRLRDWALAPKDPKTRVVVTTWEEGGLLFGRRKVLGGQVKQSLSKAVADFVKQTLRSGPGN